MVDCFPVRLHRERYMRLEDLKDPRDREHCIRAERSVSVRELRKQDNFRAKVVRELPKKGFDERSEREFQTGVPTIVGEA
jgi:hypothetical protein